MSKHNVELLTTKQLIQHLKNEAQYYKRINLVKLLLECANRLENMLNERTNNE